MASTDKSLGATIVSWLVILLIVVAVLIAAVGLLTGLPLGAVWIVSKSGCCVFDAMENVATFWGSLTAGFLALFGMLIAGVYVITAFRTDAMARAEAHEAVAKYISREQEGFDNDLAEFRRVVREGTQRVIGETKAAMDEIGGKRKAVEDAAKLASRN